MAPTEGGSERGDLAQRVIPTAGNSLINAAQRVLSDGHERDAAQILTEAVKAGLLSPQTRRITLDVTPSGAGHLVSEVKVPNAKAILAGEAGA